MNISVAFLELGVVLLGLGILLVDLWLPQDRRRSLGYVAAAGLVVILAASFFVPVPEPRYAFARMFVQDSLALFFKRLFLASAILVLVMGVEFAERFRAGVSEFYALVLFALSGMMLAASANDFVMLFVSLELITVTFYVLNSFQRTRMASLEAGVKYLILGALSSAFTVYGIALVFGVANTTSFERVFAANASFTSDPLFLLGLLLVLVGLGFKISAFPFQVWAPDVYQGSPAPATAFLAVGSKAAGFALLLRVLFGVVPQVSVNWVQLFMVISAITILYGNLCAIPQRNLKRLLGYSSIAHAGYLLLGVTAMSVDGSSAILYYLAGYLFTVLAAFTVICIVLREVDADEISAVAGLHQRSPLLAASLSMAMISLAGIPPLAGFFGKFLLFRAVLQAWGQQPAAWWLVGIAIVGVVISFYYYLGVVRAIYWSESSVGPTHLDLAPPTRWALVACIAGMLWLGIYPAPVLTVSTRAANVLHHQTANVQRPDPGNASILNVAAPVAPRLPRNP